MNDLTNTQLGQYQLIEAIGHGGMATVYKAYQPALNRFVAVKVLRPSADPQFTARFQLEAQTIARLQHPNILPIYDYGEQDGQPYFVVQYVESGTTLYSSLGQPHDPVTALQLIGQVLNALEYAHSFGVIHRDIKPANILLPQPAWPMLADFGIAKLMNEGHQLTMTGFIVGTAAYMSPEQASGQPIDGRTDLYAMGIVLYELLAGRLPFDAETPMAMLAKHVNEMPPSPRSLNPALHPALELLLLRAIEKDPSQRFQSAAEMAAALDHALAALGTYNAPMQATKIYQAGLAAFQAGCWDEAVDQLGRLAALDPQYQDVTALLELARDARQRGAPAPATPLQDAEAPAGQANTFATRMFGDATAWQHNSPTAVNPAGVASNLPPPARAQIAAASPDGAISGRSVQRLVVIALLLLLVMAGAWWSRSRSALADSPAVPTSASVPEPTATPAPSPPPPTAVPTPRPAVAPPAPKPQPPAKKPPKPPKPSKPKKNK